MDCTDILCFFFSSRRRHTRFDCDWSSDVCSSDLLKFLPDLSITVPEIINGTLCPVSASASVTANTAAFPLRVSKTVSTMRRSTPRSEERRVGKSVDLGGRRIIKKKKKKVTRRAAL